MKPTMQQVAKDKLKKMRERDEMDEGESDAEHAAEGADGEAAEAKPKKGDEAAMGGFAHAKGKLPHPPPHHKDAPHITIAITMPPHMPPHGKK